MSAEHNMSPHRSEYITDYRTILGTCVAEWVGISCIKALGNDSEICHLCKRLCKVIRDKETLIGGGIVYRIEQVVSGGNAFYMY